MLIFNEYRLFRSIGMNKRRALYMGARRTFQMYRYRLTGSTS